MDYYSITKDSQYCKHFYMYVEMHFQHERISRRTEISLKKTGLISNVENNLGPFQKSCMNITIWIQLETITICIWEDSFIELKKIFF